MGLIEDTRLTHNYQEPVGLTDIVYTLDLIQIKQKEVQCQKKN